MVTFYEKGESFGVRIEDDKTLDYFFRSPENFNGEINVILHYSEEIAPKNKNVNSRTKICRISIKDNLEDTSCIKEKIDRIGDAFLLQQSTKSGQQSYNMYINDNGKVIPFQQFKDQYIASKKAMMANFQPEIFSKNFIDEICLPEDKIYSKFLIELSVDDLATNRIKYFYSRVLKSYKEINKFLEKNPELLDIYKEKNGQDLKDNIGFALQSISKKQILSLVGPTTQLDLPLLSLNGKIPSIDKQLNSLAFDDAILMLKQINITDSLLTYLSKSLTENKEYLIPICEKRRAEKEQEAKFKALFEQKKREFASESGVFFSVVKPENSIRKVSEQKDGAIKEGIVKNEKPKKLLGELPKDFVDGHILYTKIDTFSKQLEGKKRDIIELLKKPLFPHKISYIPSTGISFKNDRDISSLIEENLPDKQKQKLLRIPTTLPVFSEEQDGFITCKRLDGAEMLDEGLFPNSTVYSFRIDNKDLSDGKYRNTEEMMELLKKRYGVSDIIEDIEGILETEKKPHEESIFLMDEKKGALQVSVWAKNKLGYNKEVVLKRGKEVKEELENLPNVDNDGFSTYGIPLKVKDLKNTIYDITEKRKQAHAKLAEQAETLGLYGFSESDEVEDTLELVKTVPEHIGKKAMADLSASIEGNDINRLHKIEFLKLWHNDYKKLLSQVNKNDAKLAEIELLVNEYLDATPEDKKVIRELSDELPHSEKLGQMLDLIK